ncbi:hypothetical protein DFH28DRAFT_931625 [Melampsora americana]|nr:hypothetical protein DFH28DRAFT_931625 [Melampsora americana]
MSPIWARACPNSQKRKASWSVRAVKYSADGSAKKYIATCTLATNGSWTHTPGKWNFLLILNCSRILLTHGHLNRAKGNRPLGLSTPYVPPAYAKNARTYQQRVLGNITNNQPPTLPPVQFGQERLNDVEWVDESVNHAHHPTRNFNDHSAGVDSGIRGHQSTGTNIQNRTVEVNENDDPLPGPYDICQQSRSQGAAPPEKKLREFLLLFIYRTKKPVNPTKTFNAPKAGNSCSAYFSQELKGMRSFDLAENSLVLFKQKLFKIADEIDKEEGSDGISSILEGADVIGRINIQIFIPSHTVYSKVVELAPQNDPGIIVTMEDPSK